MTSLKSLHSCDSGRSFACEYIRGGRGGVALGYNHSVAQEPQQTDRGMPKLLRRKLNTVLTAEQRSAGCRTHHLGLNSIPAKTRKTKCGCFDRPDLRTTLCPHLVPKPKDPPAGTMRQLFPSKLHTPPGNLSSTVASSVKSEPVLLNKK